jgi:hypothetical protein
MEKSRFTEILSEKGFTEEQIQTVLDAYDEVCSFCHGTRPCNCWNDE